MLRVAILGVGWAGTTQVEASRELGRKLTVTCLVDSDPNHLQEKADELGIAKTATDLANALADPDIDAVSICLPHALHCDAAISAAEAGKHILCEKPMALRVDEATRMIASAETAGVSLYVAENRPYSRMARFLRQLVRSGEHIGEVVAATATSGFRAEPQYAYPGRRAWLSAPEVGGTGTWMLHGIHSMAQLHYVLGEGETVYVREHHARTFQRTDVEGTMLGLLTMESGVPVTVLQTCEVRLKGQQAGYVIYGDRGSLQASQDGCRVMPHRQEPFWLEYPEAALSNHAQVLEAFADHVAGVAAGPTSGRSERRSLSVIQAGYESARSGQPVHLRTRFGDL
ncbi:MAG: hypothetical protein CL878_04025 [Dehalococcoidia bacterium]|nr:hypothetical protein [Dehalococcoidia bacterium]